MNNRADSFRDLEIYQEVCDLDLEIFQLTKSWPKEEMYGRLGRMMQFDNW